MWLRLAIDSSAPLADFAVTSFNLSLVSAFAELSKECVIGLGCAAILRNCRNDRAFILHSTGLGFQRVIRCAQNVHRNTSEMIWQTCLPFSVLASDQTRVAVAVSNAKVSILQRKKASSSSSLSWYRWNLRSAASLCSLSVFIVLSVSKCHSPRAEI